MKYRKKPVIIEAWQFAPNNSDMPKWLYKALENKVAWFNNFGTERVSMEIKTLEGNHIANTGDFIIQGIKGELYPCKPDIFEKTYEIVKGEDINE